MNTRTPPSPGLRQPKAPRSPSAGLLQTPISKLRSPIPLPLPHLPSSISHLRLPFAAAAALSLNLATAAIIVPGANGTDRALNITTNTVIDLSDAVTAAWDSDNTANAGKGVYDTNKWAVVFKYTDVTVAAGATVTFKNHPSRAPVVWLVSGNVVIDGVVSLEGAVSQAAPLLAEPGPGGARGGAKLFYGGVGRGSGFGVGGGISFRSSGSYQTQGGGGSGSPYGNSSLLPILGGSGGAAGLNNNPPDESGGGGGGGAILIACENNAEINGSISANGGPSSTGWGGGGSGGGIRILTGSLTGTGQLLAVGGSGINLGGLGRIRLERTSTSGAINPVPDPSVVDLAPDSQAVLWPPSGAPEVRVVSIGGAPAPVDPRSAFGSVGADVNLPVTSTTQVIVETKNVETSSVVTVRITPRDTHDAQEITASSPVVVNADPLTLHWTATVPTNLGYSALQVKVVRP